MISTVNSLVTAATGQRNVGAHEWFLIKTSVFELMTSVPVMLSLLMLGKMMIES